MPRPKAKGRQACGGWSGRPFRLEQAARNDLAETAGLTIETDSDDTVDARNARVRLWRETERLLGAYPGMVEAVDKAPRPAHVAAALAPISELAGKLAIALTDLDYRSREALSDAGVDVRWITKALDHLDDAADELAREHLAEESRHGQTRIAFRSTVFGLLDAFKQAGGDVERNDIDRESLPFEYVRTALEAASVPYSQHELARLVCQYLDYIRDKEVGA